MAFSIIYIVLLMTVYALAEDDIISNDPYMNEELANNINHYKKVTRQFLMDRGLVGRPPLPMRKPGLYVNRNEAKSLDNALREELYCSCVFSALAHLYLTKVYIGNLNAKPFSQSWSDMVFTKEARYALATLHELNDEGETYKSTKEVMWIFAVYAESAAMLFESYQANGVEFSFYSNEDYNKLLVVMTAHDNVVKLLEAFDHTIKCPVYNAKTQLFEKISYRDKIGQFLDGTALGDKLTTRYLKGRFSRQMIQNAHLGISHLVTSPFEIEQLRFKRQVEENLMMLDLQKAFGVQLDWSSIIDELNQYYFLSGSKTVSLYTQISSLITFQSHFVLVLKVIVMRTAISYLKAFEQTLTNFNTRNNREMLSHLNEAVKYVYPAGDRHLRAVIDLVSQFFPKFSMKKEKKKIIDERINIIFDMLKKIASDNASFSSFYNPMEVTEDYLKERNNGVNAVFSKYNTLSYVDLNSVNAITGSSLIMELFYKYLHDISKIDFEVVYSLTSLKNSEWLAHLKILEEN